MSGPDEVTALLKRTREGDARAQEELMPLIYDTMRRLAANCMRWERNDHTLQPTALVHEAYLRMLGGADASFENRSHFFSVASHTMRCLLVDHARSRVALKRGGGRHRVELDERILYAEDHPEELLSLDDALNRLKKVDERQAAVVELRFFGGLSMEETAKVLGVSTKTVDLDWKYARAWLLGELAGPEP